MVLGRKGRPRTESQALCPGRRSTPTPVHTRCIGLLPPSLLGPAGLGLPNSPPGKGSGGERRRSLALVALGPALPRTKAGGPAPPQKAGGGEEMEICRGKPPRPRRLFGGSPVLYRHPEGSTSGEALGSRGGEGPLCCETTRGQRWAHRPLAPAPPPGQRLTILVHRYSRMWLSIGCLGVRPLRVRCLWIGCLWIGRGGRVGHWCRIGPLGVRPLRVPWLAIAHRLERWLWVGGRWVRRLGVAWGGRGRLARKRLARHQEALLVGHGCHTHGTAAASELWRGGERRG